MKKKVKIGDLTLNQIVEIAEKYDKRCSKCPLYNVTYLPCYTVCQSNIKNKNKIKQSFNTEIEVEEDE